MHYADGGGKAAAAMHPIEGRDRVSRLLTGLGKRFALGIEWELVEINGETGIAFRMNGTLHSLATIQLNEEGKISGTYFVVNPEKLPR
jgi:RNA polymerase sigma-70 factor (ECF subfamily)